MKAGLLVVGVLVTLIIAAFGGLISVAERFDGLALAPVLSVARFTVLQAGLSTFLSLALGALLALALARRQFSGRSAFIAALGAIAALPPIVVVFALTAIWGRAGFVNDGLAAMGLQRVSLYGLGGILLAHVFFNAPFAARAFLAAIERTPGEHWRLASSLGMTPFAILRSIDAPILWRETPSLAILIFLVCATSFAIPLALGGGPGAATLEVAIYEALRFDVDFSRAAMLAGIQVLALGGLALAFAPLLTRPPDDATAGRRIARPDSASRSLAILDMAAIGLAFALVLPPLIAIAKGGAALSTMTITPVLKAAATSLLVATPSALLSVAAAIALARARIAAGRRGSLFAQTPLLALAMPPLALASGFYALARQIGDPSLIAWPALIFANALTALPFVYRLIEPPLLIAEARFGRLARSLGVSGLARLRFIEGPLLRAPVGAALALAGAFSLGDLGVVALFGGDSLMTLPLLLYERLGAYRMAEADAIAACLAALVLALFIVSRRLGGRDARAS